MVQNKRISWRRQCELESWKERWGRGGFVGSLHIHSSDNVQTEEHLRSDRRQVYIKRFHISTNIRACGVLRLRAVSVSKSLSLSA